MIHATFSEGFEVEAPPTMYGVPENGGGVEEDFPIEEQLPIANDYDEHDDVVMNNLPNSSRHATKKYLILAALFGVVVSTALFGVGLGIGNAVNKSANEASVSSASNMALTASTNGGVGAKAAKAAKSSKSKSGKSEDSRPTKIVANGIGLPFIIDDDAGVAVTLPVTLGEGSNCTAANVAIAIGIDHTRVGDLAMELRSPDGDSVLLINQPPSDANFIPGNLITFDDSDPDALDTLVFGANVDGSGNLLARTYFAQGNGSGVYPNPEGLGKFNGITAKGDWRFDNFDVFPGNTGTIESVELTITCK